MKSTADIPITAYVSPDYTTEKRLEKLDEARTIAIRRGDESEEKRIERWMNNIKAKNGRQEVDVLPVWLMKQLGGHDPITGLLRNRQLTERQGYSALTLRLYEAKEAGALQSLEPGLFIDKGFAVGGMEALVDRLTSGAVAKSKAIESLPDKRYIKPIHRLTMGACKVDNAVRMIGGANDKMREKVKDALRQYLDTAANYLWSMA